MKIETINELLIDVIGKAAKITVRNPNQPVLENVLFEVELEFPIVSLQRIFQV